MECEFAEEEVKGILEVIASTGRFWYDFISNFPSSSLVWLDVVLNVYFDVGVFNATKKQQHICNTPVPHWEKG